MLAKHVWNLPRQPLSRSIPDGLFVFTFVVAFLIRCPDLFVERLGSDEALYAWYAKRIAADPFFRSQSLECIQRGRCLSIDESEQEGRAPQRQGV